MSTPPEIHHSFCRHLGGFVRMLRIIARVLELEDEPAYEGYFPRVGGPRLRRTARKATGHLPRLQHQPPQPVSSPAEPRSPVVDTEDGIRDIEMIP
ncbi:hypothetical protein GUJ93_ZPchr0004g39160 [Zizania palustris]|uniref:Uncharacterized protein n=1 Tax=Zizania palustris TaxID=103762 RepID=A0A8J5VZ98_ZIZPA|nr:hypothetical protein GUJ93_ZPchr0004g39160 [Zizania palustris]